jgi:hypothetical protein
VTPPVISVVSAASVTSSQETIAWTTDEPATSQVEYGLTTAYGSQTMLDSSFVTAHSQTISGLLPGTAYNYRVKSPDAAGNLSASANFTFTTPPLLPPPTAGLIGYWPFDEGSGNTTADRSGNNHNGALTNSPAWTTGKVGNALRFDATDNLIDTDDPRVVIGSEFDVSKLPFTLSAWINVVDFNDYRAILSKRDSPDPSAWRFDWGFNLGSGTNYLAGKSQVSFGAPPTNTWTHVTIVAGLTDTKFYLNGTLAQAAGPFEMGTGVTANTVIGGTGEKGPLGDNDPFKGMIDEVRIYDRALSIAEVEQVYRFAGDSTPPVITNVSASGLTAAGATITWTTDELADGQVDSGTTTSYGQNTPLNPLMALDHSFGLSGLSASTMYHFSVKSKDAAGNVATSKDFTFTTLAPPAPPTTGLIGYWAFDEGRGNTTADSSGNRNTGYLSHSPKWTTGKIGKALRFDATHNKNDGDNNDGDGNKDDGNKDDDENPRVIIGSKFDVSKLPFTLSAWINPADFKDNRTIFSKRDSYKPSKMRFDWGLGLRTGSVYLAQPDSSVRFKYGPPASAWTHLTVVATKMDTKLYVNGTLQQTLGAFDLGSGLKANTVIGGTGESSERDDNDPFNGMIDELRVYDRALSASEIQLVYQFAGGVTPTGPPKIEFVRIPAPPGSVLPSGVAIISLRVGDRVVTEAEMPASRPIQSGRIYVEVDGSVTAGISMANLNPQDAVVSFHFTTNEGIDFGQGSFTLYANRQISALLTEAPFSGPTSMQGTLTFSSSVPISVVVLRGLINERSDFLLSTLPVIDPGAMATGTIIPHIADGGGWRTEVVLVNPTDLPLAGSLQFLGSTFNYQIAVRGAVRFPTQGKAPKTQIGSVRITPRNGSIAPSAFEIVSVANHGVTVSETNVPAFPAGSAFRMYVKSSGVPGRTGSIQTTLSIVNPEQSPVTVNMELNKMDGASTGLSASVNLGPGGQLSEFVSDLFPRMPSAFQGALRLTATSPVSVIGFRATYNGDGDSLISATLPSNEAIVPSSSNMLFPYIASGSGFTTEIILFGPR